MNWGKSRDIGGSESPTHELPDARLAESPPLTLDVESAIPEPVPDWGLWVQQYALPYYSLGWRSSPDPGSFPDWGEGQNVLSSFRTYPPIAADHLGPSNHTHQDSHSSSHARLGADL